VAVERGTAFASTMAECLPAEVSTVPVGIVRGTTAYVSSLFEDPDLHRSSPRYAVYTHTLGPKKAQTALARQNGLESLWSQKPETTQTLLKKSETEAELARVVTKTTKTVLVRLV